LAPSASPPAHPASPASEAWPIQAKN
jgi:hypothetical protein